MDTNELANDLVNDLVVAAASLALDLGKRPILAAWERGWRSAAVRRAIELAIRPAHCRTRRHVRAVIMRADGSPPVVVRLHPSGAAT